MRCVACDCYVDTEPVEFESPYQVFMCDECSPTGGSLEPNTGVVTPPAGWQDHLPFPKEI